MEMINDNQLDDLIRKSLHRQDVVSGINDNVMRTVQRTKRKAQTRKLLRLIIACVGVPLLLLLPTLALMQPQGPALSLTTIATVVGLLFFYIPVVRRLNQVF